MKNLRDLESAYNVKIYAENISETQTSIEVLAESESFANQVREVLEGKVEALKFGNDEYADNHPNLTGAN